MHILNKSLTKEDDNHHDHHDHDDVYDIVDNNDDDNYADMFKVHIAKSEKMHFLSPSDWKNAKGK